MTSHLSPDVTPCHTARCRNKGRLVSLIMFFVVLFIRPAAAQWYSTPELPRRLVQDVEAPVNIATALDSSGGAFLFWQSGGDGQNGRVLFSHIGFDGKSSFRADGKTVTTKNGGAQENPVPAPHLSGTAVVVWKDYGGHSLPALTVQRVSSSGILLWNRNGISLTSGLFEVFVYDAAADSAGSVFVAYTYKDELEGTQGVRLQKLNADGFVQYPLNGIDVSESGEQSNQPLVLPDGQGGARVVWIEYRGNRSVVLLRHITAESHIGDLGDMHVVHEGSGLYSHLQAEQFADGSVYVVWQNSIGEKGIHQQIISAEGKPLLEQTLLQPAQGGTYDYPAAAAVPGAGVALSWTNRSENGADIFMQLYTQTGEALWGSDGVYVTDIPGYQFGPVMVSDGMGGLLVSWFDRRDGALQSSVYAQRIDPEGNMLWNTNGVPVALTDSLRLAYLSVVPDLKGGLLAVFSEETPGSRTFISGQRVYGDNTFSGQITDLYATVFGDSVALSWTVANEEAVAGYSLATWTGIQDPDSAWQELAQIPALDTTDAFYEHRLLPEEEGTLYFRLLQRDDAGKVKQTSMTKLVYYPESNGKIFVAQNLPNPFADSTIIEYHLPEAAPVSFEFYNTAFELVNRVELPAAGKGRNELIFYAGTLTPGVYFYRFSSGRYVEVKKMVILP